MCFPISVDMVDLQELETELTATGTNSAVVLDDLDLQSEASVSTGSVELLGVDLTPLGSSLLSLPAVIVALESFTL